MDIASGVNAAGKAAGAAVVAIKSIESALSGLTALVDEINLEIPLTFSECVKYFVSHAKSSQSIAKGAILRKPTRFGRADKECWEICLIFLDKNNEPVCGEDGIPLGFKTVKTKLDRELENSFKNGDLIVVE